MTFGRASSEYEPTRRIGSKLFAMLGRELWDVQQQQQQHEMTLAEEEISSLHSNPTFLPTDRIRSSLIRIIAAVFAVTVFYFFLVQAFGTVRRRSTNKSGGKEKVSAPSVYTVSYQATNLLINLGLGLLGMYHFLFTVPSRRFTTAAQRIEGFESMSIFAELQIAYQLWAIPVGYFLVDEHGAMLLHHACVVVVGFMSAFFTNGFRYYTPFFYGLIELSSVPLAVMNAFKTNPAMVERFPGLNTAVRLTFAFSFLTVRFAMWMPNIYDYLRICAALAYTCGGYRCRAGLVASWLSALGLTALQLLWAGKIVQGLAKLVGVRVGGALKKDEKKVS